MLAEVWRGELMVGVAGGQGEEETVHALSRDLRQGRARRSSPDLSLLDSSVSISFSASGPANSSPKCRAQCHSPG